MRTQDPSYIEGYAYSQSYSIFQNSSLLVWQYELPFMHEPSYNFSFDLKMGSVKRDLLNLLVARETFKKYGLGKEVIFQNIPSKFPITENRQPKNPSIIDHAMILSHEMKAREFQMDILLWAKIQSVRVIFKPAFDLKKPNVWYASTTSKG